MKEVTLIQCTDTKRSNNPDEVYRARDLYDESSYFRAMREWAIARGDPWYILSAKHGLLAPGEIIAPYNERGISKSQAIEVALALGGIGVETVHITAGMDYTNHLIPELETEGIDVVNHFAGMQIGNRKKNLKKATIELTHDTI